MEKRTPHYKLDRLKELIQHEDTRLITARSLREAAELGYFSAEAIVEEICLLSVRNHFDKSMTAHGQSKIWQDVYKKPLISDSKEILLYIKLQENPSGCGVVVSFHKSIDW